MNTLAFFTPFITIFALIGLGALVAHLRIIDEHGASQLVSLVVNVTLPVAIFMAVVSEMTPAMLASAPLVVLLAVVVGFCMWLLARALSRPLGLRPDQAGVYAFAAACSNSGFLGLPLVMVVFGPIAAVTATMADFAVTINIFTFAVAGLDQSGKRLDLRLLVKNLLNPLFLALVVAVLWSLTGVKLPSVATDVLRRVGDSTTPLGMIALGHMLKTGWGKARFRVLPLGVLGGIRLVVAPLLMLLLVWLLPMTPEAKAISVLEVGMPPALLTAVLARQYGADHHLGLAVSLLTTVASLVTLPLLAFGVRWLFGLG